MNRIASNVSAMRRLCFLALIGPAVHVGCAGPTQVSVRELRAPPRFEAESGPGKSIATWDWKRYFGDANLTALIEEALRNSLDLQIALQRIELARAAVTASTGALLPQADLGVGVGVRKFGRYTMDGAGNATTDITPGRRVPTHLPDYLLALQSTWELDLWGRLRSQRKSAVAQYLATFEASHLVITSLVADIAASYYELVAVDHAREVLTGTLARQAQALEVVRLQKEAGRANELAVQQFEAQLADTRGLESELAQLAVELENRINTLIGRYPTSVVRTRDALFVGFAGAIAAGVPSDLLHQRPDIREAELLVQASKYDVAAARAAFFPSLTLSAGLGLQAFSAGHLFTMPESLIYNAGGSLVAPLINRAALNAQLRGATATQLQAIYHYQRTVLNAYVEVINVLRSIENTRRALASKQEQKAALLRAVETADTLYRAGKATYLEVLVAQQNTLQAELELIETQKRERITTVAIYKALGGGWRAGAPAPR